MLKRSMSLKSYAILAAMMHNASKSNMPTLTLLTNATYLESAEQEDEQAAVSAQTEQSQEQLSAGGVGGSSVSNFYNGGLGLHNQQRGLAASGVGAGGAAGAGAGTTNYAHVVNGSVNLLLGGSMLCLVTTILCVVCYCCHRNIRKRTEAAYRQQQQQQQQQQHQWLENDPNLEIYSVEQCYESSGLFLGDSMEGLAALPALHHQPPPSYDVVLQEQQQQQQQQQQQLQLQLQQQQQQLLQRVSPPPGYRSTLDLGSLQQVAAAAVASGSGSMDAVPPAAEVALHKQLQRSYNAQSCCSLQRAEVENMWQAAATSTAVPRSSNCLELDVYRASHRHLALKLSNHYKRGCPLCGKFRYAEDEALTASVESNWQPNEVNDNVASAAEPTTSTQALTAADAANGNVIDVETLADINDNNNVATTTTAAAAAAAAAAITDAASNMQQQQQQQQDNLNENGIISMDMSKIIDKSGLPSYEGALKLESSGYV